MKTNISSVVEFQIWWVLKSKIFAKESTYSKEKKLKNSADEFVHQKIPKSEFESWFLMSKIVWIFLRNFSMKNINLGHQLLLNIFFDKFNFENNLFLKSCPIFGGPSTEFLIFFPSRMLILGQKSCFLKVSRSRNKIVEP